MCWSTEPVTKFGYRAIILQHHGVGNLVIFGFTSPVSQAFIICLFCNCAIYIAFYIFPCCLHPTTPPWFTSSVSFPWMSRLLASDYSLYLKMGLNEIFKEDSSHHVIHSHRHFRKSHYHHIGYSFFITTFKTPRYDQSV